MASQNNNAWSCLIYRWTSPIYLFNVGGNVVCEPIEWVMTLEPTKAESQDDPSTIDRYRPTDAIFYCQIRYYNLAYNILPLVNNRNYL